jgi:hypothetical protein
MAQDELVGNIPTEQIIAFFEEKKIWEIKDSRAWEHAMSIAVDLFALEV